MAKPKFVASEMKEAIEDQLKRVNHHTAAF